MTRARNVADSGLVLINSTSISAATSVSINNCFSSVYNNYRIVVDGTISTSDDGLAYRLRASGTDLSSSVYYMNRIEKASGGFVYSNAAISYGDIGTTSQNGFLSTFDLSSPYLAKYKFSTGMSYRRSGSYALCIQGTSVDSSSSYDGITIFSGASITGTVKIYGYK